MATTPELIRSQPILDLLAQHERDLAILRRRAPHSDACIVLSQNADELRTALSEATAEEGLFVSLEEAAGRLSMDPAALRRLCRLGRVPGARKLAGEWRIPVSYLAPRGSAPKEAA